VADLVLAIDPGNTESAYALIRHGDCRPVDFAKLPNEQLLDLLCGEDGWLGSAADHVAIEMVASYGMPVCADVFETCVWIGRFQQALDGTVRADLVKRHPVKLHHCHNGAAKDSNIAQALKDRFALGQPNHGKGTKAAPGWFYGFAADVWQAYALAVYVADTTPPAAPSPPSVGDGARPDARVPGGTNTRPATHAPGPAPTSTPDAGPARTSQGALL
jgi:hypothetical protein